MSQKQVRQSTVKPVSVPGVQKPIQTIPLHIYARGGFKVLPLCAGFVVVGMDGKEIDRYKVGEIETAVELVDELSLKVA